MKSMTDKTVKKTTANLPDGYAETLQEIKARIRSAQVKASPILAQPVQEGVGTTLPQPVAETSCRHKVILFSKTKPSERETMPNIVMTPFADDGQGDGHE